ncbi:MULTISPECIES: response regulator transcription factor [Roseomonadaceae]|uniref:Response regulator transcription factor n=1 Tax=Falsiroseomonas oleicola TaxID=2801474 RepID=A0ABS6HAE4_9PROT|nr:response regulator transcription factor [Roseomonas oleicola]MBU8545702.1 response regulator transcription factor [Roseomonas oleicola]
MADHPIAAPFRDQAPASQRPVLVLEDDAAVSATICTALARDGWTTVAAATLAGGRLRLQSDNPRIVIADLGLPDGNGIAFVREAARMPDLGIIVVSGRSEEVDRVVGLEVGADDYLTKPFSLREMVARVRALSRRLDTLTQGGRPGLAEAQAAAPVPPPALAPPTFAPPTFAPPTFAPQEDGAAMPMAEPASWAIAGLALQPARQRILAPDGAETRLTGAEAGLLRLLLTESDHLAAREAISERVLGRKLLPEQRGVDQLASNLRQKLLAISAGKVTIAAQRGRGYRLVW